MKPYKSFEISNTLPFSAIQYSKVFSLTILIDYIHHGPTITSIIGNIGGEQGKVIIEQSPKQTRRFIEVDKTYHFKYCIRPTNGFIKVLYIDSRVYQVDKGQQSIACKPIQQFKDIVRQSQILNTNQQYFDTILYVIEVKKTQKVKKENQLIDLTVIKCFAHGSLVDVSVWGSQINLSAVSNKWNVFSGFKVKQINLSSSDDIKFSLYSSVYSNIFEYKGELNQQLYDPQYKYQDYSRIYEERTVNQLCRIQHIKNCYYSQIQAWLKDQQKASFIKKSLSVNGQPKQQKINFIKLLICDPHSASQNTEQSFSNSSKKQINEQQNSTLINKIKLEDCIKKEFDGAQQKRYINVCIFGDNQINKIIPIIERHQLKQKRQWKKYIENIKIQQELNRISKKNNDNTMHETKRQKKTDQLRDEQDFRFILKLRIKTIKNENHSISNYHYLKSIVFEQGEDIIEQQHLVPEESIPIQNIQL